jgi:hypothetical protein
LRRRRRWEHSAAGLASCARTPYAGALLAAAVAAPITVT